MRSIESFYYRSLNMMMTQSTRPIFVVGAPRSGTTLLQYMLRSHPNISLPTGESHFLIPLYRQRAAYGDMSQRENIQRVLYEMHRRSTEFIETDLHGLKFDVDALAARLAEAGCRTLPQLFDAFFTLNAEGEDKRRWGDKTPYYVLHIPLILEMFPGAQIIHLIRDGRDVALSMFARKYDFHVYNTYHAAKYWQQYVETGREYGRKLSADVYHELRYEDLVFDPAASLRRLCAFLGEEYSDDLLNYRKAQTDGGKTPLLKQGVKADNAEKWRAEMTPRQIQVFEAAAGTTLREHGYALATEGQPLPLALRGAYRLHNRLATRWRRFTQPR